MVSQFQARRDAALAVLDAAGVRYVRPGGAFYLYVDVGGDGDAFADGVCWTSMASPSCLAPLFSLPIGCGCRTPRPWRRWWRA